MIFFKSDLERAALLSKIETERALFQEWHLEKIKTAQNGLKVLGWAKNHPYLTGAGCAFFYLLLPRPKMQSIARAARLFKTGKQIYSWLQKR